VAASTEAAPAGERFGTTFKFDKVFEAEVAVINERRRAINARRAPLHRPEIKLEPEGSKPDAQGSQAQEPEGPKSKAQEPQVTNVAGEPLVAPTPDSDVVGLALSGGGIRSAAVCLGVLQALDQADAIDKIDYLSTVSGGGYVGSSLTAALEWNGRETKRRERKGNEAEGLDAARPYFPFTSRLAEDETPALQHIRDYSNYLFPHGAPDLRSNAAIYVRGLVANAVLVTPFLLGAAALTLLYFALRGKGYLGFLNYFRLQYFFLSLDLALLLVVVGIAWGIARSWKSGQGEPEIPGRTSRCIGWLVIAFFIVLFGELQPFIVDAMAEAAKAAGSGPPSTLMSKINKAFTFLAPVGAALAFFANKLGEYVKGASESTKWTAQIKGIALKVAIYVGGLILPAVLWLIYLNITYWGLLIDIPAVSPTRPPQWLAKAAHLFGQTQCAALFLYLVVGAVLFVLSLCLRPNANSLHPLYRDRLAKAFLFKPQAKLKPTETLKRWRPFLSEISGHYGPYHLINAALNVQASRTANRRGRNADFFIFSSKFVGSKSTDYVHTTDMEELVGDFDLAAAMATSGAAVSSNMGAESIKPLTATLALLNIRLGYWLRNPSWLHRVKSRAERREFWLLAYLRRCRNIWANYYFLAELFGQLSEKFKSIYLTDGGHIENLGIYELLQRRCRVIIAVDAEADPQMALGSFNMLERYALIDLGIRIDLPWEKIAKETRDTANLIETTGDAPKHHGPHCAIGEISYPEGKGILVYIKASLTGDENDYVFDYKKRHYDFPHETTLDQMFTEEQFEAYRALGFHAAFRLFDRGDVFAFPDPVTDGLRQEIAHLDELFPRAPSKTGDALGQKQKFTDWLPRPRARRPRSAEGAP
jgi:hypothetical protein